MGNAKLNPVAAKPVAEPISTHAAVRLQRVKKAYEQIADQLRDLILVGRLKPGMRLPTEVKLAAQLGVSRATVRESLRVLVAEGLVRTAKGAGGGSYVTYPSLDRISAFLRTNITLLSDSQELSLSEFLEARELLEIPAAKLAAKRSSETDVARLHNSIPTAPGDLTTAEQFVLNRDFHSTIVDICANSLLSIAAQPIFLVLQTRLARTALDDTFHAAIIRQHKAITRAIEMGDEAQAGAEMAEHLAWLRPMYERVWLDMTASH
jgi:GntR family transcriptional repressor for pyruvate dehydrogenase complex